MALLLSKKDVADLLSVEDAIAVVEEAFRQLALGQVTMPQRTAIRMPEHHGLHLGMPAYIGGSVDALALKVVTVYPENPSKHGLPTTIGVLLLNDPATGQPLAVMDAGFMTAVRTGAVSGVATKYLARKRARAVGVIGAGVMAQWQLAAVCAVRAIDSIVVYDKDADRAASYAAAMSARLDKPVSVVTHPKRAIESRDIVIVATSATEPVFDGSWLSPGQHVNAIGSHAPGARELDTATVVRSRVFPDYVEACLAEAGDLLIPLKEGAIGRDHLRGSLGDVIAGLKPGRERDDEITLFKSVGLAIQDVAVANLVYQRARLRGMGVEFAF
jgi:ornithine cyclodeaminase/alanine dehydrogenase